MFVIFMAPASESARIFHPKCRPATKETDGKADCSVDKNLLLRRELGCGSRKGHENKQAKEHWHEKEHPSSLSMSLHGVQPEEGEQREQCQHCRWKSSGKWKTIANFREIDRSRRRGCGGGLRL